MSVELDSLSIAGPKVTQIRLTLDLSHYEVIGLLVSIWVFVSEHQNSRGFIEMSTDAFDYHFGEGVFAALESVDWAVVNDDHGLCIIVDGD